MIPLLVWIWTSLIPRIKQAFPALIDRFFPKMSIEERAEFDPNAISCPFAGILPGRPLDDEDLREPDETTETTDTPQGVKVKED